MYPKDVYFSSSVGKQRTFSWLIEQIYHSLPQNRDWLNPDYEAMMKYIVKRYCKE